MDRLQLKVEFVVQVEDRNDYWCASVEKMPVFTYGKTEQEAREEAERVLADVVRRCHERAGVSGLLTYLHRQGVAFDIKSGRRTRQESSTRKRVQLTEELELREAA
ncbi:MAG: hypothetical protein OXC99_11695 [Chloroflexi bacterium]|nr:hypothetical protein [Chloroflexota bacterium]